MLVFWYIGNEPLKIEIKTIVLFTIALKGIKYLGINLRKYVQDLY